MSLHEITGYDACVHALKQTGLRQSLYDEAAILMDRVLVNLHGPEHRDRRNQEATVFRKDVFFHYEKSILPQTLEETIAPFRAAGKADLVELGYRIMMNLTVDFTGIDRTARSAEETGHLLTLLRAFSLAPALGQSRLEDTEPLKVQIRAAMAEFDRVYFRHSLERRRQARADLQAGLIGADALPNDVLMALVMAEERLALPTEDLLKEAIFFVLAGAHTSIHSLTHAVHELFVWLDAHPEDAARLKSDPFFVQRCVFESLRLHPSSPEARRRALCPVRLADGSETSEDDRVAISLHAANRDHTVFGDDAEHYDPHRAVPAGHFPFGLSMGFGMHACLGRNLAVGTIPKDGADPDEHQYGTVPLIVAALLKNGVERDPAEPPQRDETITRVTWARYPIRFNPSAALL